jgi:hypothetical protein
MAHILEFITKDKKFTASEVIQEQLTHLLVRMSDFQTKLDNAEDRKIVESWRNELFQIRCAVDDVLKEE